MGVGSTVPEVLSFPDDLGHAGLVVIGHAAQKLQPWLLVAPFDVAQAGVGNAGLPFDVTKASLASQSPEHWAYGQDVAGCVFSSGAVLRDGCRSMVHPRKFVHTGHLSVVLMTLAQSIPVAFTLYFMIANCTLASAALGLHFVFRADHTFRI